MEKDVNKRLNQLMLEFDVGHCIPGFKMMVSAEELIAKFTLEHYHRPWILIAECKSDIDFFCKSLDGIKKMSAYLYKEMNDAVWKQLLELEDSHEIMIVSFYGRQEIWNDLYNHGIKGLSIYDYFAANHLFCAGNYYDVFRIQYYEFENGNTSSDYSDMDLNSIFFYDRRCYETVDSEQQKSIYLSKMIFDCAYARDFGLLKRYIGEYSAKRYEGYMRYEGFLKAVSHLLNEIKVCLEKRKTKDIIMFWLDALEWGDDSDMPYLSSLADQSMEFENAYTVTPYTHSTAKTLFHEKYVVDDQAFRLRINASSRLCADLDGYGYKTRFYTNLEQVESDLRADMTQSIYTPLSMMCWNCICDLLNSNQAVFEILHEVFHTHFPYGSMGLTGTEYSFTNKYGAMSEHETSIRNRQMIESRRAADQVLQFYSGLLNERMFKIYMSDHGHTYLDRYHTTFRIVQKDIVPQRIHKMFSYINFGSLIKNLLAQNMELPGVFSEFVKIQDVDYYYKDYINYRLGVKNPNLLDLFGYEGIVTETEYYLRYNDGREEYYNSKSGQSVKEEKIGYLRSICPVYPPNLINDEKFKYSRLVYKTLENYTRRNKEFEEEKMHQIMCLFQSLSENEVIALRGGGMHTYRLWLVLPWELKRKINYIIDGDRQCMAARLGIEIISLDNIHGKKVSTIIISSFEHEREWMEELSELKLECRILGLYSFLKKQGVACQRAFYHNEYISEDIALALV